MNHETSIFKFYSKIHHLVIPSLIEIFTVSDP